MHAKLIVKFKRIKINLKKSLFITTDNGLYLFDINKNKKFKLNHFNCFGITTNDNAIFFSIFFNNNNLIAKYSLKKYQKVFTIVNFEILKIYPDSFHNDRIHQIKYYRNYLYIVNTKHNCIDKLDIIDKKICKRIYLFKDKYNKIVQSNLNHINSINIINNDIFFIAASRVDRLSLENVKNSNSYLGHIDINKKVVNLYVANKFFGSHDIFIENNNIFISESFYLKDTRIIGGNIRKNNLFFFNNPFYKTHFPRSISKSKSTYIFGFSALRGNFDKNSFLYFYNYKENKSSSIRINANQINDTLSFDLIDSNLDTILSNLNKNYTTIDSYLIDELVFKNIND